MEVVVPFSSSDQAIVVHPSSSPGQAVVLLPSSSLDSAVNEVRSSDPTFVDGSSSSSEASSWILEVERSLTEELESLEPNAIYPVPQCLKNGETEMHYHAKEMSFGPHHFKQDGKSATGGAEIFKSDVTTKFNRHLNGRLSSVVDYFNTTEMQDKIKKSYAMPFGDWISSKTLSWMLVRDACFVLEVLNWFSEDLRHDGKTEVLQSFLENPRKNEKTDVLKNFSEDTRNDDRKDKILKRFLEEPCYDNKAQVLKSFSGGPHDDGNAKKTMFELFFNRKNHHPFLNAIVKDMFKLENQLPLWVLNEIRKEVRKENDRMKSQFWKEDECWFEYPLKNLSPIEIGGTAGTRYYSGKIHILNLLAEYMVDKRKPGSSSDEIPVQGSSSDEVPVQGSSSDEIPVLGSGPNVNQTSDSSPFRNRAITMVVVIFFGLILFILSTVFILWFLWLLVLLMWDCYQIDNSPTAEEEEGHVPTVEELIGVGVQFKKLECKGISHIIFDESSSALYLPKFRVDDRSEVLLRNLMVMETHMEGSHKPITRYVLLMNDLVNTSGDAAILRQRGIITNKLGSDNDAARLWNSISIPATDIPSYQPIKKAAQDINKYRKGKWKILRAQFWMLHCSKPWLAVSLLGGISLLILTVMQVVCLFRDCQIGGDWGTTECLNGGASQLLLLVIPNLA